MGNPVPYVNLSKKKFAKIILLSDVHWGSRAFAKDRFMRTVDYISRHKNTYCILGGDLVELVTRSQKGNMLLEQEIPPTEQIENIVDVLMPLVKKGKVLGTIRDNHLQRLERDGLVDMNKLLAKMLGVPYWSVGGIIKINVNDKEFKLAFQHGKDGCKNPFVWLDKMMRVYPGCDIYALAHNHQLVSRKIVTIGVDANGEECGKRHFQVRTGSYLKYGGYAKEALFEPAVIGSPIVWIDEQGGIEIDIRTLSWDE